MFHNAAFLKRLDAPVLLIVQSAIHQIVEAARGQIRLKPVVNGLRTVLVKP